MKKLCAVVFLLAIICVVSLPAAAADIDKQKPFTAAELRKLKSDWPQFIKWTQKKGEKYELDKNPDSWAAMRFSKDVMAYLEGKGWKPERFFYVASHVSAGLAMITMSEFAPQMIAQLEVQKEMIKNNPQMTPAQKQQMIDQINISIAETKKAHQPMTEELPPQELKLIEAERQELMEMLSTSAYAEE